jgi:hypothetical protein
MRRRVPAVLVLLLTSACSGHKQLGPTPTPVPAIHAVAGELRGVPDMPDDLRRRTQTGLDGLLTQLYERTFLGKGTQPVASPVKTARGLAAPGAVMAVAPADLLTQGAQAAFGGAQDAFSPGPGVTVSLGAVRYSGVATVEGGDATTALVKVDLDASGSLRPPAGDPLGPRARRVRLKQTGTLLCVKTPSGWRIGGWDVQLTAEREVLGAASSGSPQAARWWPA